MGAQQSTLTATVEKDSIDLQTISGKLQLQAANQIDTSRRLDLIEFNLVRQSHKAKKLSKLIGTRSSQNINTENFVKRAEESLDQIRHLKADLGIGPTTDKNNVSFTSSDDDYKTDDEAVIEVAKILQNTEGEICETNNFVPQQEYANNDMREHHIEEEPEQGVKQYDAQIEERPSGNVQDEPDVQLLYQAQHPFEDSGVEMVEDQGYWMEVQTSDAIEILETIPEEDPRDTKNIEDSDELRRSQEIEREIRLREEEEEQLRIQHLKELEEERIQQEKELEIRQWEEQQEQLRIQQLKQEEEELENRRIEEEQERLRIQQLQKAEEDRIRQQQQLEIRERQTQQEQLRIQQLEQADQPPTAEEELIHQLMAESGLLQQDQDGAAESNDIVHTFDHMIPGFSKLVGKVQRGMFSEIWHIGPGKPHIQAVLSFFQDKSMFLGLRYSRCRCDASLAVTAGGSRKVNVKVTAIYQKNDKKTHRNLEIGCNELEIKGSNDDWESLMICMAKCDDIIKRKLVSKGNVVLRYQIQEVI